MKKIRFLSSIDGDWVGLYIDGELIMEGHSFSDIDLARTLCPSDDVGSKEDTDDKLFSSGRCPDVYPFED